MAAQCLGISVFVISQQCGVCRTVVPNPWLATPKGVAKCFLWGRRDIFICNCFYSKFHHLFISIWQAIAGCPDASATIALNINLE